MRSVISNERIIDHYPISIDCNISENPMVLAEGQIAPKIDFPSILFLTCFILSIFYFSFKQPVTSSSNSPLGFDYN